MKFNKRTHTCGELRTPDIGKSVILNGWVDQKRDLGGVIFVNVRDRYGVTQVTFNPEAKESYPIAEKIGNEFVVSVSGIVQKRTSANPKMPTGEIEVLVNHIEILNTSEVPPFVIEEDVKASEELRFKYRYLDIRRKKITENLMLRSKVYQIVHRYFEKQNFIEVETPVMMKSTPEGARDYLVPSRIHHGKFYALPQSPQTYKQVLMVSGLDRYVQICKCFRDEDLRADRQPEFTQIDLEMSFVEQEDVFEVCEGMICDIWKGTKDIEITMPFKRMTYDEAMESYGTDKPDLRYGMKIEHFWSSFRDTPMSEVLDLFPNGEVAGIKLEGKEVTRKMLDDLNDFIKPMVSSLASPRLNFIKVQKDEINSSLKKLLDELRLKRIIDKFAAKTGDTILLAIGEQKKLSEILGKLRIKLAEMFNLIDESKFEFLWIYDFPLFGYDEEEKCLVAEHHLFTMPKDEDMEKLENGNADPENNVEELTSIRAVCYDLVCNGNEFGSGSIRIHRGDIQQKVFNVVKLTEAEQREKFGFLLDAFKYGAPPHGGFAFGLDRIVAILCGTKDIRETIAFPKTTSAISLMDGCPSNVETKQLRELGIDLVYK